MRVIVFVVVAIGYPLIFFQVLKWLTNQKGSEVCEIFLVMCHKCARVFAKVIFLGTELHQVSTMQSWLFYCLLSWLHFFFDDRHQGFRSTNQFCSRDSDFVWLTKVFPEESTIFIHKNGDRRDDLHTVTEIHQHIHSKLYKVLLFDRRW